MEVQSKSEICNECQTVLRGLYCSNCGRPSEVQRINSRYLISEIGQILNLEKGILFTIRELLIRPGHNIQQFIVADRQVG